jgi:acetyl-CoA carboxylase biotin carboxyl carrier protein
MTTPDPAAKPRPRSARAAPSPAGNGPLSLAAPSGAAPADGARLAAALERDVPAFLNVLRGSAVEELRIERDGLRIALRRAWQAGPAVAPAAPAQGEQPEPSAAAGDVRQVDVRSQFVGIFHRAREQDGPVLATEGEHVRAGQALGVVETLGIANDVEAPVSGRLERLLVTDGQPVEYGQVLAVLLPD